MGHGFRPAILLNVMLSKEDDNTQRWCGLVCRATFLKCMMYSFSRSMSRRIPCFTSATGRKSPGWPGSGGDGHHEVAAGFVGYGKNDAAYDLGERDAADGVNGYEDGRAGRYRYRNAPSSE